MVNRLALLSNPGHSDSFDTDVRVHVWKALAVSRYRKSTVEGARAV